MRQGNKVQQEAPAERLTIQAWVDTVVADERSAVKERLAGVYDGRQTLAEYWDAANEDRNGLMPHEAGYEGRWDREARLAREAVAAEHNISEEDADAAVIQLIMRFAEPVAA